MSVVNSFSPNTRIESADVNENNNDIADEITNSLPINGVKAMAAPLPLSSGAVDAPGLTFSGDTNTGWYRIGADNMGASCNGAKVLDVSATGLGVTGTLTSTGAITGATGLLPFPTGTLMLFQQTAAPTGWTKQTTHNDKALRVVSGTPSSGGSSPFSTVFGLTATQSHTLSTAEIPAHTHGYESAVQTTAVTNTSQQVVVSTAQSATSGSTGGGGGHTHNIELRVHYVDLIIAARD
jgi:hypothetical protein